MEYVKINVKKTGENINRIRKEKDVSVEEIKNYMGMHSPTAIYKWFRGETLPSIDNLVALSAFLGVAVDEMIVREE
ncbi:MAG: helix-turn-helix transcriptional regulator [Lachnospiraceae bacterium]|nr:helix-turn-helix transcriptional regulator [Lachnospiraceae bacterium]